MAQHVVVGWPSQRGNRALAGLWMAGHYLSGCKTLEQEDVLATNLAALCPRRPNQGSPAAQHAQHDSKESEYSTAAAGVALCGWIHANLALMHATRTNRVTRI